jgi:hypothetical protein
MPTAYSLDKIPIPAKQKLYALAFLLQQFHPLPIIFHSSMLRKFNILLFILPVLFLASCQDVIDIDIPEGETRVIINGRVTDTLPVYVEVKATVNYLSTAPNPGMSNCIVKLFEDGVEVATLAENDTLPGYYEHPFTGTENSVYSIEVTFPEGHPVFPGERWISQNEKLSRVPNADSTYSRFQPRQPFIAEGYYAYVMFTEPAGRGDFYRQRLWKNDSLFASQFDLTFFNDEFIDGRSFNDIDLPAVQISGASDTGDVYVAELSSISAEGYRFLELLQQQTVQVGSTFDPPPAPIFGNIVNADDPNQLGLGYFFASKLTFAKVEIVE